tara:strand:- start:679 stop:1311 length:633 start_codon:yes stop_codon:yes gene_type:complete
MIILISVLYILYLNYLIVNKKQLPNIVRILFNNIVARVLLLLLIIYLANSKSKIGGFSVAVCLAISYLLTYIVSNKTAELFTESYAPAEFDKDSQFVESMGCKNDEEENFVESMGCKNDEEENFELMQNNSDTPVGKAFDNKDNVQGCDMTKQFANSDTAFHPEPFRPDESVLGTGGFDSIPLVASGNDFNSKPPGPYTTSGTAYEFNMS